MKNLDVMNLLNGGILMVTSVCLDAETAYKVVKLKKALKAANVAIIEGEKNCQTEAGIPDAEAFDARRNELLHKEKRTKEEQAELVELEGKLKRYMELRQKLYEEEATITGFAPMPYPSFHELQKENASVNFNGRKINPLDAYAEEVLEGILWVEPEE